MTERRPPDTRAAQAGITLLEVLLSMAVLSFMMIMMWSTTSSSVEVKTEVELTQQRQHELRVAMNRLVKDIQSAYLAGPGHEKSRPDNRRTIFLGKSSSPVDELRLSSLSHRVLWAEANESEQAWISYSAESDPEDRSKTNLIRRESRRLSNEPWE
ncbi:MAG: prepilin-type N-terminal cleavage/methylation domain-containing protein, partial [Myxococcota bacterium]